LEKGAQELLELRVMQGQVGTANPEVEVEAEAEVQQICLRQVVLL
jgi:hypothetical protein